MTGAPHGSALRHLREHAGWSQEELAAKAQVSRASIQNWESNRTAPRRAETRRLAAAFGLTVDQLKARLEGERLEPDEIRAELEAAVELEDPVEMRAALQKLLARITPEDAG
jgi:transcriptional regulator with XRE-family HTH domain